VLAVNALLVGAARVLAYVHSPLDIAAGFLIGAVAAALASWLAPVIVRRIPLASAARPGAARPRGDQLTRPRG
jgi:membrane-associated phospholipid phosphatase